MFLKPYFLHYVLKRFFSGKSLEKEILAQIDIMNVKMSYLIDMVESIVHQSPKKEEKFIQKNFSMLLPLHNLDELNKFEEVLADKESYATFVSFSTFCPT